MTEPQPPALRASDADRERTADMLRHAAGEGRLTVDELDERLNAAYASRTHTELERLVVDIVAPDGPAYAPASRPGGAGVTVRPGPGGARWLIAIMGGCERKGRWRVGRQVTSINLMGGADIDLNDAELAAEAVELQVFSIMGGADVYVPDGVNVEVSEFAFMGGNSIKLGEQPHRPGAPTIRIRLFSLMGGTDVTRGRRKSRAERRAERERHRLGHG